MAYVSPTILPSGTTFSQFHSGGLQGQLARLCNANAFPPAIRSLVMGGFDNLRTGLVHGVDAFNQGDPVATAEIAARLLAHATALKALTTAVDEINVLIDANPGSFVNVTAPGGTVHFRRRGFP